jgi:predicted transcriptional regulator
MSAILKRKSTIKSRAVRLVREMPENSSWDDLMHRIYVRQKIEAGLADIESGKVRTHASICREFGCGA